MYDYRLLSLCIITNSLETVHFWNVVSIKKNINGDFLEIKYMTCQYNDLLRGQAAFHVNQIRNMQIVVQVGYLKDDPFKEVIEWPPK